MRKEGRGGGFPPRDCRWCRLLGTTCTSSRSQTTDRAVHSRSPSGRTKLDQAQRQLKQALWILPRHLINLPFWSTLVLEIDASDTSTGSAVEGCHSRCTWLK